MKKNSKVFIAGHKGLVGSALLRNLKNKDFSFVVLKTRDELNLLNQKKVEEFFKREKIEYVFIAAAKVGGIYANMTYPADFINENIIIQSNIINAAFKNNIKKMIFLGSSCIYPKNCNQPIKEEYLLEGPLEITNEAYAIAKIAGLKTCYYFNKQYNTNYITVMPTNLYGPNDNFDLKTSHVLAALIRKFHEAKIKNYKYVEIWGTGKPLREFLHVDDLADCCVFLMENHNGKEIINIGTGIEISIKNLAFLIKEITKFDGEIRFNEEKPDGTKRKLLDISRINKIGWKYNIKLEQGIIETYNWYKENLNYC
jgi:GDP-L-fucose synthase